MQVGGWQSCTVTGISRRRGGTCLAWGCSLTGSLHLGKAFTEFMHRPGPGSPGCISSWGPGPWQGHSPGVSVWEQESLAGWGCL